MSDPLQSRRTARFYTGARRVTVLIGKLPNGGRVPGGPYTIVQIVVGSLTLLLGWNTRQIWGGAFGSPLTQLVALAAAAVAATWFSGKIPSTKRKIPDLMLDTFTAVVAPSTGTYKGSPIRLAVPHFVAGTVLLKVVPEADTAAPLVETLQRVAVAQPTEQQSVTVAAPSTAVVTLSDAPEPGDVDAAEETLPDNVIPLLPRKTYNTGLDRLLDQARRKDSN
jgi:hypothetical protein